MEAGPLGPVFVATLTHRIRNRDMAMRWQTSRFDLDLSRPLVMGIVNITPDSFSDGGRHDETSLALRHAEQLLKEGADILDLGGESTRPGADRVSAQEEMDRLVPFLQEAIRWQVPISVDTYKPEMMQVALDMGVDIINDVWALRQPGAENVIAAHPCCGVCLMHMHRDPQTMQICTMEGDVLVAVSEFLEARVKALQAMGVGTNRLILDPGIGFGKTVEQNFRLLAHQGILGNLGLPILAGWSRKSSLGAVLTSDGRAPEPAERLAASVAAALMAVDRGASVVRVHDVKPTVDALKVWQAMQQNA
jgi:dihydropteroate synthase